METARGSGAHIIDRCNLTIIEESDFADLPAYLANHQVEVIALLPCYTAQNVAKQRGQGVFEKSISALRKLNAFGYGTTLPLNLVYNPIGPKLPDRRLSSKRITKKFWDANLASCSTGCLRSPTTHRSVCRRFAAAGQDQIQSLLSNSFNPATVDGLMCRTTLSVGWMGEVYDCDFNQMLGMQMRNGKPLYLWDMTPEKLEGWAIRTGEHCLACTAGCGSSCTGALEAAPA